MEASGKVVRFLVEDGAHVAANERMSTFLYLKAPFPMCNQGATLAIHCSPLIVGPIHIAQTVCFPRFHWTAYVEIEVMKMIIPLLTSHSGDIHLVAQPGMCHKQHKTKAVVVRRGHEACVGNHGNRNISVI
jgi:hypothetical protein